MSDEFNYNNEYKEEPQRGTPQHGFDLEGFPPQSVRVGFALALVLLATVGGAILQKDAAPEKGSTLAKVYPPRVATPPAFVAPKDPFADVALDARAAYVLDIATGNVLFEKNANTRLPLASVTKIMTALIAAEESSRDTLVTIRPADIAIEGDSGLRSSEQFRLRDILALTLVGSSNDGAHAIAASVGRTLKHSAGDAPINDGASPEKAFLLKMNERAQALGLTETSYLSVTGLDRDDAQAGAYGSARDTAQLFSYALGTHPEIFNDTSSAAVTVSSLEAFSHTATNTNERVLDIPGIIASKTGYTSLAGGNLAVIVDAGLSRPVVIVVLASTTEGRFSDIEALTRAAIATISAEGKNLKVQ
ncbi:MAG: hypothetical protein A2675_03670 [Candidatus Yonathbacteria bacterium RIFCSPHIGHO2_01_FULL_51_10]|uniref:Peptidase S11 D-alanyl-D-alanine carboxypeptidase A N-terminal domain-containing protein n=1 Tax=Candidatus Yonathbacteria bacterium RIFCSPHIGHO2_01_FULL_51_10 TaxID=1802723 RepID=A0A1G2SA12_9BACT|nr:MAG: hypothetical protein A2675_03670 [Candidatus Yonathbacteria bacterium RIFCSPHIGHO2_01_FULL_51_10]